jgi:uncharacterized protein YqeY
MNARLKDAMKARDERTVGTLRMVRARVMERQNAADFDGDLGDEVVQSLIAAYVKQLQKALPDYERAGEPARETVEQYRFEIEYLSQFLPALYDDEKTRAIVTETIEKLGVTDPKRAGQVMGAIMKEHKGKVDAARVRRFVDEAFGGS